MSGKHSASGVLASHSLQSQLNFLPLALADSERPKQVCSCRFDEKGMFALSKRARKKFRLAVVHGK
jgi:hypothetical protein